MKITNFVFSDSTWNFSPVDFDDYLNLFVGESGSGKTRLLNVLFNITQFASKNERFCSGDWKMDFSHRGKRYQWEYSGISEGQGQGQGQGKDKNKIIREVFRDLDDGEELITRSDNSLKFKGNPVPKLSSSTSAIYLFKEEESISGAHEAVTSVMRRNFFELTGSASQ